MVVHGIPGPYRVAEGDLITIDVGVDLDGAIADSAYTFGVGSIDPEAQRLLDVCQDALAAGIAEAQPGNRIGDISSRDPDRSSKRPDSPSSAASSGTASAGTTTRIRTSRTSASPGRGPKLSEGMTIAIEPMITIGLAGRLPPR